jgi:hypothetical protein
MKHRFPLVVAINFDAFEEWLRVGIQAIQKNTKGIRKIFGG